MMIQWTEDLSVGVEKIDEQHKELFRRVDNLLEAMKQGNGIEEVDRLIDFLQSYTLTHFSNEENLMIRHKLSIYPAHKEEHERFKNVISDFRNEINTKGIDSTLAIDAQMFIVDWLISHVRRMDRELGKLLK